MNCYPTSKHLLKFRNSEPLSRVPARSVFVSLIFVSLFLNFIAPVILDGCAAPGQPITRRPPAPTPISDLSARQIGGSVAVTFTLPKQTVQGRPLAAPPQVDIYREFVPAPAATQKNASLAPPRQQLVTIPSQTLQQYRAGEPYSFSDVLSPDDLLAHAGSEAVYMVRTRAAKHDSADSNLVAVPIFPAPQPILDLQAQVTRSAIILSWMPPPIPQAPAMLGPISLRYQIYRAINASSSTGTSPLNPAATAASSTAEAFQKIAEISSPPYRDENFTFGQTYAYYAVSIAQYAAAAVESEPSATIKVTPRDTFPPPAPTGLVAAVAPATASTPAHVDLSWDISDATGVAGYNIYRSSPNTDHTNSWYRLTGRPLLTPTFRDIPPVAGRKFFYRVTAVDTFGNESAPSTSVTVNLPAMNE
ncbi:MAG TPA: fibronectin type III domain-containing protein [Candidatus Acidoferrales bacterium]|nr:fibronectin type III domain-containing protein [Candidatus Acidoferrales bacterium]